MIVSTDLSFDDSVRYTWPSAHTLFASPLSLASVATGHVHVSFTFDNSRYCTRWSKVWRACFRPHAETGGTALLPSIAFNAGTSASAAKPLGLLFSPHLRQASSWLRRSRGGSRRLLAGCCDAGAASRLTPGSCAAAAVAAAAVAGGAAAAVAAAAAAGAAAAAATCCASAPATSASQLLNPPAVVVWAAARMARTF